MNTHTTDYIQKIAKLNHHVLQSEFIYLKDKTFSYHNSAPNQFNIVIESQRKAFNKLQTHVDNFINHQNKIISQNLKQYKLSPQQQSRFEELFYKEGFLINYIKSHQNQFSSIINKQHKLITHASSNPLAQKISDKFHQKSKTTLLDYLHKEENLYSNYLSLMIQNTKDIEEFSTSQHKHELYKRIEDYIFDASVAITAIPLGPLELASIPFWGTYFSLKELEKLDSNFQTWKKIEKPRLTVA